MVKINTNFSKLNASLKQMGAELNFRYHFNKIVNCEMERFFSIIQNFTHFYPLLSWSKPNFS